MRMVTILIVFFLLQTAFNTVAKGEPIQWSGNDHWYEVVYTGDNGLNWDQARSQAEERSHQGVSGHLVTITSSAENQFISNSLGSEITQAWQMWTGGIQTPGSSEPGGGWTWYTGEEWTYSNWGSGEPSNWQEQEDRVTIWRNLQNSDGLSWNDEASGEIAYGYVVEYNNVVKPSPKIHAVVVGCETSMQQALGQVTYHGDDEAWLLCDKLGRLPNHGVIVPVIINDDDAANPQIVMDAVHTVASNVSPGDTFLFFETGHGATSSDPGFDDLNEQSLTNGDEYLCLSKQPGMMDCWLSDNQLANAMRNEDNLAFANNLVILTGCHTGGFFWGGDGDLDEGLDNIGLIAGATEDETATWFSFPGTDSQGSLLGSNLVQALSRNLLTGYLSADENQDGNLTFEEIFDYMAALHVEIPNGSSYWVLGDGFGDTTDSSYSPYFATSVDFDLTAPFAVPEPIALSIFGLGGLMLLHRHRVKSEQQN